MWNNKTNALDNIVHVIEKNSRVFEKKKKGCSGYNYIIFYILILTKYNKVTFAKYHNSVFFFF